MTILLTTMTQMMTDIANYNLQNNAYLKYYTLSEHLAVDEV
jgi:hypothetical protein